MIGWEYGNTRLRAMRARLLGPDAMAGLLETGSLDRMLGTLAETELGPDVEWALARFSGVRRLDEALRRNLSRILASMGRFYEGGPAEEVALLADRWMRLDLRTIVRLPDGPSEVDPSEMLVPVGRLDAATLAEVASMPDLRRRMDVLVSWDLPWPEATGILVRALAEYERTEDRSVLERAVDVAFAARVERVLEGGRAAVPLRGEIDSVNLLTALRLRAARAAAEPVPDSEHFVPGGSRDAEDWAAVVAAADDEGAAALGSVAGIGGWDEEVRGWVEHGDPARLADGLRRRITAFAVGGFASGDPLSFDVPVAYVFAKEAEIRDLRLIGRALVHGLGSEVLDRLETAA